MLAVLTTFVIIGAFVLGIIASWLVKGYVEDYIDNLRYAKAITHPEMLDEDGNLLHDDLLYIRTDPDYWVDEDEDDE